ncbi:S1 family peptidase [Rhizohabitans arisaemae]|uniref:S1 family peptidase n=1 Tax=Rhizohabitans arisaemae TaxID=2720610 RepID=UPI0024B1176F|nr:S1 family peptidase [Rhizohabitans arisaemae]
MLRRLASAGTVIAATAVVLTTAPVSAEPTPLTADGFAVKPPPAEMLDAMQRDLRLTPEQAITRLANEERAARQENTLRKGLAGKFGGAWLNADASKLVVATTDAGQLKRISLEGGQPVLVAKSLAQLEAVKARLDAAAASGKGSVPLWYVDTPSNSVVVQAADQVQADAFIGAAGLDRSAVRVEISAEQYRSLYDIRGGDAYYMGSGGRCSVGFSVTRGTQQGFATAGHCGNVGESVSGFNRVAMGSFQGSSFPGNDYAWVATNANWTAQPWVKSGSSNVTVAGSTQAAVGASICRSGSTTGWRCGTIQQHNTSVTYPEGTITGVTRTTVCAEPGDSGGSYISGSQAQGVTSGGSGNCTSGGTTFHQPINEILSVYGLTLKTSGTPPPTGCTGYQNTYTGSLTSGGQQYQPTGGSYTTTVTGTHRVCLDGPNGVDFDIYLQKLSGTTWSNVASGTSANPDEAFTYNGTAGTYRVRVHAYSGSGSYTLGLTRP